MLACVNNYIFHVPFQHEHSFLSCGLPENCSVMVVVVAHRHLVPDFNGGCFQHLSQGMTAR